MTKTTSGNRMTVLCIILAVLCAVSALASSATGAEPPKTVPEIEAGIYEINKYGNIILDISGESMLALGYEPADLILVQIGDAELIMPLGTSYSDADSGDPICCLRQSRTGSVTAVILSVNSGNLAKLMGVADDTPTVRISMAEKEGYADEYRMHSLGGVRTNNRGDYAQLSDEEYANFRAVATTGMGTGTLFRSSSPINPALNRNEEADEALFNALVRSVVNMADSEEEMIGYADYCLTHYSECEILALGMNMDIQSDEFRDSLCRAFRFIASQDGPYLIHCKEGKDRTGFGAAVLECFMGAGADEVTEDYMLSYFNFYGIGPESGQYESIADSNIRSVLSRAFGIVSPEEEDLQACAEKYLKELGMTGAEIEALRENLSKDCGVLGEPLQD